MKQQIAVLATYADGTVRDVTREAFIESGNIEVVEADTAGPGHDASAAARRRCSPATKAPTPPRRSICHGRPHRLRLAAAAGEQLHRRAGRTTSCKRVKILPSDLCTDAEFVRRVYLDLTGLPPDAGRRSARSSPTRATARVKRDALVDQLVGSREYVEHWTNKWADLLQVNRKFLGEEGRRGPPQLDQASASPRTCPTTSSPARS